MKFIGFLLKNGKAVVILSALFGSLAGFANAKLVRLINSSLETLQAGEKPEYVHYILFVVVIVHSLKHLSHDSVYASEARRGYGKPARTNKFYGNLPSRFSSTY